jgi:hypothetical protein
MTKHTPIGPQSKAIERYVAQTAQLLGLRMSAADNAVVISVFGVLAHNAEALLAHALSESIDAGPIFRIPSERDG